MIPVKRQTHAAWVDEQLVAEFSHIRNVDVPVGYGGCLRFGEHPADQRLGGVGRDDVADAPGRRVHNDQVTNLVWQPPQKWQAGQIPAVGVGQLRAGPTDRIRDRVWSRGKPLVRVATDRRVAAAADELNTLCGSRTAQREISSHDHLRRTHPVQILQYCLQRPKVAVDI